MNDDRESDRHSGELLRASQHGEREALIALLARHLPRLRRFARLRMSPLLRAREAEEDLVQSACVAVLRALPEFEYRGEEAFRGWLYTAVTNKVLEHERRLRAQRRDARRESLDALQQDGVGADSVPAPILSPSQELIADERLREIELAFDGLPDAYREVLALSRLARMSRAAIAAHLGKTEDSVRNLISRALAALAQQIERMRQESSKG